MDLGFIDFDSSSESGGSEDQDDAEFLYRGHACSILSNLQETIGKIDDFLSFDREFVHGNIVCSEKNPSGQMGKVVDVDITVDLENIRGTRLREVNSKLLKRIRSVSVGDYVVSSAWLGKVQKIVDRIIVHFDDGTKSEFSTLGPEKLVPISPCFLEDYQYPFYPGQRVLVENSSVSKSTRWLCGTKKNDRNRGTVCSVDAGLVYVDWFCCEMVSSEKISTPPRLQDFKNLSLLPCFSHANWQLGDWCVGPVVDCKTIEENFLNIPSCGILDREKKSEMSRHGNLIQDRQEIAVITKTKTAVNVLWQDGSLSLGLDSRSLLPVSVVDAHDFFPEQLVLEKDLCDNLSVPSIQRWGVVKSVDAKERTVKVKWNTVSVDQSTNVELEQMEEIVSAYELVEHPDYSYLVGDVVLRLQECDFTDQSPQPGFETHLISKCTTDEGSETDHQYALDHKEPNGHFNHFLSTIGIVIALQDGEVEVKWAGGATSKVAPYEIYQVEEYESLSPTIMPYNQQINPSNEDMTELRNQSSIERGKDDSGLKPQNEECENKLRGSSSSSFPQSAIGLFTSIKSAIWGSISSSLFGGYRRLSEVGERNVTSNVEEVLELCNVHPFSAPPDVENLQLAEEINPGQNIKEVGEKRDHGPQSSSKCPELFRQFDVVNDCSDHHFVHSAGNGQQYCQINRVWLKKVQQEWNILKEDLPETIFIRGYEERMNLLRAAVVGAPGTPYHDGLFLFDIFLPPEYPYQPPVVYYNSGGLRLNPNLYETGKVCLSLLNTWTGSRSEVWNPEKSTILQVLLSLQALVLNEKPYFNEAGYDSQAGTAEGEKNSVSYNENAFVVSCKSMLYLLRKPPKHFEALILEHFSQRCNNILLACKAYMGGAPAGFPFEDENDHQEIRAESSTGFKIMIAKLYPRLVEAFSEKGMDCGDILSQEELPRTT